MTMMAILYTIQTELPSAVQYSPLILADQGSFIPAMDHMKGLYVRACGDDVAERDPAPYLAKTLHWELLPQRNTMVSIPPVWVKGQ